MDTLMTVKIYEYKNCDTCKKALKFLSSKEIESEIIPIVDQPPTIAELKLVLASIKADGGTLQKLFNTSGQVYRELKIGDKLKQGLSESEALKLLAKNGKLIKRPVLIYKNKGKVGFDPKGWSEFFSKS